MEAVLLYYSAYMNIFVIAMATMAVHIPTTHLMDLQEVGCGYVDWIGLAQDRDRWRTLVSAVMDLRVP